MTKKLYDRVPAPIKMRHKTAGFKFYVPDTRTGMKVAHKLNQSLNSKFREELFKTAAEEDEDDLAEAYKKMQDKKDKKKEDKEKAREKEDNDMYDEDDEDSGDEDDDPEYDEVYGRDSFME